MFAYDKTFDPEVVLGHYDDLISRLSDFALYLRTQLVLEETVGREIFRFAQHPPHTRFDTMGGFFDQYEELLGTLSPCDMVHLSPRSRYVCYPSKPEMCSKFAKYTMNL